MLHAHSDFDLDDFNILIGVINFVASLYYTNKEILSLDNLMDLNYHCNTDVQDFRNTNRGKHQNTLPKRAQ